MNAAESICWWLFKDRPELCFLTLLSICFGFNADPGPAFYASADLDPGF
jgi:hypothetical protein